MAKVDSTTTTNNNKVYIAILVRVPSVVHDSSDISRVPNYLTEELLFNSKPVFEYSLTFFPEHKKDAPISLSQYLQLERGEEPTYLWNKPNRAVAFTAHDASVAISNYCRHSHVEVIFEVDLDVLDPEQQIKLGSEIASEKGMCVKIPPHAIRAAEYSHLVRLPKDSAGKRELLPLTGVIPNPSVIPPVQETQTLKY